MSLRTSYKSGEFCWIDLMAHDMDSAAKFYGSLLGWTADAQDTQGGPPYTIFQLGGKSVAGMGLMSEEMKSQGAPPIWNSYVNVADLQSGVDKAVQLGGSVMTPPMQVMDAGSMAIISDPGGAMLSLWQGGSDT
jgi:predicted enzyme related to lactoylglutathione lyase